MFKHLQLIGLSLSAFLLMLGDGMVLALLPSKVISLTGSSSFVGYLASTYALAQVISQIPIGMLADRVGSKHFILMGYLLSFSAGLLFTFTNSLNLIFWGRIMQGIGEAPILSLAPALLSLQYPTNKGKAIGFYNASIYMGLTAGPLLRVLLFKAWSDNQIFLFYAVMCFVGAVITKYSLKNKIEAQKTGEQITINKPLKLSNTLLFLSDMLKNPQILTVLLGIALYGAGFGIFMTIIPAFLLMGKHYNQSLINIFFALFYVTISLAQMISGWLSDRLGWQLFMLSGMLIATTGLGIVSYFEDYIPIVILCISSFGLGLFYLASLAFLNENAPASSKGAVSGVYYLFWGLGMFWGPMILANYIQYKSYQAGLRIFSLTLLTQVILLFITRLNLLRPAR